MLCEPAPRNPFPKNLDFSTEYRIFRIFSAISLDRYVVQNYKITNFYKNLLGNAAGVAGQTYFMYGLGHTENGDLYYNQAKLL